MARVMAAFRHPPDGWAEFGQSGNFDVIFLDPVSVASTSVAYGNDDVVHG